MVNDWLAAHPDTYPNDDPAFISLVDRQRRLSDGLLDIRTIDADGGLHLVPSRTRQPIANVAGHEDVSIQFLTHGGGIFIGRPVFSRASARWIVPVTARAQGNTVAVIGGVIELGRVGKLFEPQRMGPGGSITVIRADGTTLFRAPAIEGAVGKGIAASPDFIQHFSVAERGIYRIRGAYDGAERVISFSRLKGYPIIVAVTARVDDVLRPWWRETLVLCGIALAVTILAGVLTYRFLRQYRLAQDRIEFLAYRDGLTGLPNRRLARDRFIQAMAHADRAGTKVAMLFLDLDHFKVANDSLGHAFGDSLLKGIAGRVGECVRDTDTVSRHGGDEFLVLLADLRDNGAITLIAEKILQRLEAPFDIDGNIHLTSMSIGIAVFPDDGKNFDVLLKKADLAMYKAKESGRNTYCFYNEELNARSNELLFIQNGLRQALVNGEFILHYQPQYSLATRRVIGAEALIRWNHPTLGLLPPGRFIPIAEEIGSIVQIGAWVIGEACRQAMAWRTAGLPVVVMAVNLSALQFKRGNLEQIVLDALKRSGLEPRLLELELTESALISDVPRVLATVEKLRHIGLRLSIDDFGTGYSSLAYLKRLKVDKLKIDRSFVCDAAGDPEDAAIVRTIIQIAKSLNLETIAEGVEDEETLSFLAACHCDEAQGYHLGRPMEAAKMADLLRRQASSGCDVTGC